MLKNLFSSAEYYLFLFVASSFIFQPTNIRFYDTPITLISIITLMVFTLYKSPRTLSPKKIYLLFPAFIILIVYDQLIMAGEVKSLVFFCLLCFVTMYYAKFFKKEQIDHLWEAIGLVCFFLALIGGYRFLTGYQGQDSENITGFMNSAEQYVYFGISYLPSTRNSDAIYFGIGALFFLWRIMQKTKFIIFDLAAFYITILSVTLSLSRGVWLATFIAVLFTVPLKRILILIAPMSLLVFALLLNNAESTIDLIYNGVVSLFDPETANFNVSGYYTYSNDDRLFIYQSSLKDFLSFPFGYGLDYIPSYAFYTGAKEVHSENLYLDLLLVLGIFSLPFIYIFIKKIVNAWKCKFFIHHQLIKLISIYLVVYSFFNSGVDFVIIWFLICLINLTINTDAQIARKII